MLKHVAVIITVIPTSLKRERPNDVFFVQPTPHIDCFHSLSFVLANPNRSLCLTTPVTEINILIKNESIKE